MKSEITLLEAIEKYNKAMIQLDSTEARKKEFEKWKKIKNAIKDKANKNKTIRIF